MRPASASPRSSGPLSRLGLALLASALGGLLLAALAFPVVGLPALAAKSTAEDFLDLPAELTAEQPPTRTRILGADDRLLATLFLQNRVNVPLSTVPVHVRNAVLAIEDSRFYEHNGVDGKGTLRAAVRNTTSDEVQGGSTLTQQYVKNALLNAARDEAGQRAATEQSVARKVREARYALAIEKQLSKDEIFNRYLNIAYFGNGAYGIAAAAQYYFGKPVQALTVAQGAMLAGMVQNPSRFDPTDREKAPGVVARRNLVMRRMADLGYISPTTFQQGSALPLGLRIRRVGNGCDDAAVSNAGNGFFCDYVRRELEGTDVGKALGGTLQARQSRLLGGGLVIRTTLDARVQQAALDAVEERVPADDPSGARVVADVVEPGTGHIKAMAVNQKFGERPGQTKVNYAVGGTFGFQGGSTFKAFVLASAVQQGIPLGLTLYSPQEYTSSVFKNCGPDGCKPYTVSNAEEAEEGTFDVRQATHLSVNTFYLQLEEKTGVDGPAELAEKMGLRRVRDADGRTNVPLDRGGSFVLGTSEVSPLAMAGAYATFAARGTFCRPQAVLSITDGRGRPVPVPKPRCGRVMDREVADTVNDVLRGVIDGPNPKTGKAASIGRPAAGKTGTTNSSRAAWFVGYTPDLATAVWVGQPDKDKGTPQPMRRTVIGGRYFRQVYGGTIPAAVWRLTMREALRDEPESRFGQPTPQEQVEGEQGLVPDLRGRSVSDARRILREAGYDPEYGGSVDADYVPEGTVAYSSPGRGRSASPGQTVTVFTANGRDGG